MQSLTWKIPTDTCERTDQSTHTLKPARRDGRLPKDHNAAKQPIAAKLGELAARRPKTPVIPSLSHQLGNTYNEECTYLGSG